MPDPVVPIQGDTSEDQAALSAKIDEQLGLPHQEVTKDESTTNDGEGAGDSSDAGDDASAESEEVAEGGEEAGEESAEEAEPAEPVASEPSNPDLFIEVEDADGVTHKISKIEDLPEDFSPKNNRQGLEILSKLQKLDHDIAKAEAENATKAEADALAQTQKEQFNAWDKEANELAKQKRLDVKDTERIDKVFGYMNEINAARAKAGNPNMITSLEDALDKFEAKEAKDKVEDEKKAGNDLAKKKASIIGTGGSGTGAGAGEAHKPYVSGSARTIDDVDLS